MPHPQTRPRPQSGAGGAVTPSQSYCTCPDTKNGFPDVSE